MAGEIRTCTSQPIRACDFTGYNIAIHLPLDIANTRFSLAISSFSISVDRQLLQNWTEFLFLFNCWLQEMCYRCSHSDYFCFYICNWHRIPILQEMQTWTMFKRMAGSSGKTINFSCQNHFTIFAFLSVDLITARDELSVCTCSDAIIWRMVFQLYFSPTVEKKCSISCHTKISWFWCRSWRSSRTVVTSRRNAFGKKLCHV